MVVAGSDQDQAGLNRHSVLCFLDAQLRVSLQPFRQHTSEWRRHVLNDQDRRWEAGWELRQDLGRCRRASRGSAGGHNGAFSRA